MNARLLSNDFNFVSITSIDDGVRRSTEVSFDAKLGGRIRTGFLTHSVFATLSQSNLLERTLHQNSYGLLFNLNDVIPEPDYDLSAPTLGGAFSSSRSDRSSAIVLSDVVSWSEFADLTVSLRNNWDEGNRVSADRDGVTGVLYQADSDANGNESGWRPTYALAIKPFAGFTIYGSYSDGFVPQDNPFTPDGSSLEPATYINQEVGVKYAAGSWTGAISYFDIENAGQAQPIPGSEGQCGFGPQSYCYFEGGTSSTSTGVDVEVAVQMLPWLSVLANYNRAETELTSTNLPIISRAPVDEASVFLDIKPSILPDLQFHLGLRYRGEIHLSGFANIYDQNGGYADSVPYEYAHDAYLVADFGVDYQINERLSARLFVEDLIYREYFSTVGDYINLTGSSRSVSLTLRWRDRPGSSNVRPLLDGLAPFGSPADWNGASTPACTPPTT